MYIQVFWMSQKTRTKWLLVAGRKDDVFNALEEVDLISQNNYMKYLALALSIRIGDLIYLVALMIK